PEGSPQDSSARDRVPVPEPTATALSYHRSGTILWVVDTLLGLLLPAAFLFTGWSSHLRGWAQAIGRRWFFVVALYFLFFTLVTTLLTLPLAYYETFVREHAYGLSNQTLGKWVSDQVNSLLVGLVIGALTLWVPYLLLARSPKRWWLFTGLLAVPFIV